MIVGVVNADREPIVRLRVIGPLQTYLDFDVLVDTGYTHSLILPPDLATALDLIFKGVRSADMADGSQIWFNTYDALIEWDGTPRPVTVSAFGGAAIIGMGLLDGHELRVEAVIGGAVEIRPLVTP